METRPCITADRSDVEAALTTICQHVLQDNFKKSYSSIFMKFG